jgi:2-phospho-L-lactate guanylyltransferase
VDRVLVISNEARALDWARRNGWEALAETCQISESVSVDTACAHCAKSGVQALLRIPTDIPLVCRDDIEEVFAALLDRPGCVIVPSRDGTGTNALLRSPPALFPSSFGKDSFARHLASAGAVGVAAKILRNDRIEFDVDEADDLELLRREVPANSRVGRWFSERDRVPPAGSGRGPFPQARQA